MTGLLYALIFPSGKAYIGVTSRTLEWRVRRHLGYARRGKRLPVSHALRKYNFEFKTRVLCIVNDTKELMELETLYIGICQTQVPNGYNVSPGGETSMMGRHHTPATKFLMSLSKRGKKNPMWGTISPTRGLFGKKNPNFGRKHSLEAKRKISEANRGKKGLPGKLNPMWGTISPLRGKKHTTESKEKMSLIQRGERNSFYGRKHTLQTRAKMRASHSRGRST